MDYRNIVFKKKDGTATVFLNRPERMNALDIDSCNELFDAFGRCGEEEDIRAVVLAGTGKSFCAGGDVREMRKALEGHHEQGVGRFIDELNEGFNRVILAMIRLRKPVIGAIRGNCSGGGAGLAFACDMLVAGHDAKINIPNARIGLIPDGGNSFFLIRKLGLNRAAELFFLAGSVDAEEGKRLGVFNRVVDPDAVIDTAESLAKRIAQGPGFALGLGKFLLHKAVEGNLESQLETEREGVVACVEREEFKEGITAFFEKRPPNFFKP